MNQTLTAIHAQLNNLISQVQSAIPNDEPFGIAHGNWSFPCLTRSEMIDEAQSIINIISARGSDDLGNDDYRLKDYSRRLDFLRANTVPQLWSNAGVAVPTYMLTLAGLRTALTSALPLDDHAQALITLRKLTAHVRGMESRIKELEPRTNSLASMVERIENAYNAADRLPTDMESLAEERQKLEQLVREATTDKDQIGSFRASAEEYDKSLSTSVSEANSVLERCETAYSAATSVGLAAAFTERSAALSNSMWIWVAGLIAALCAGS